MNERFKLKEVVIPLATFGLLSIALFGAFSRKTKYEIHRRDGWRCVGCGSKYPLEASHFDHNKSNPEYDNPANGDTRCPTCHLKEHIEKAGKNGLSLETNDWAITQLLKRI